jgi:DNA-binding IclR family transcriptional regulator
VILAHLPPGLIREIYEEHGTEIRDIGLAKDWTSLTSALAGIRKAGHFITRNEIDPGRIGIGAPILGHSRRLLGSLSFVITRTKVDARAMGRLVPLVMGGCREIEAALRDTFATPVSRQAQRFDTDLV